MVLCPLMKEECKTECAWFQEEECAVARLHDVVNSLDEVKEAVYTLDETIQKKDFAG